jgi:hypothetical protein
MYHFLSSGTGNQRSDEQSEMAVMCGGVKNPEGSVRDKMAKHQQQSVAIWTGPLRLAGVAEPST